jgi:hypothetical protein
MNANQRKGMKAEESLRLYFLSLGYFVVRGVPFTYSDVDVTDVDLWLYNKASLLNRERVNVDIKNRSTPKAMERIFWSRGLQLALGLEHCIVATNDRREATTEFGKKNDVLVLGGSHLAEITRQYAMANERIVEEDLYGILSAYTPMNGRLKLKHLYVLGKGLLVDKPNYGGCNLLLSYTRPLFEDYAASSKQAEPTLRLLYLFLAYFVVLVDFSSHAHSHTSYEERREALTLGFRFGEAGEKRAKEIIKTAAGLIPSFLSSSNGLSQSDIQKEIYQQLLELPVEMIAEYLAKADVHNALIAIGLKFEHHAFSLQPPKLQELEPAEKSLVVLLADFFEIDRKKLI